MRLTKMSFGCQSKKQAGAAFYGYLHAAQKCLTKFKRDGISVARKNPLKINRRALAKRADFALPAERFKNLIHDAQLKTGL